MNDSISYKFHLFSSTLLGWLVCFTILGTPKTHIVPVTPLKGLFRTKCWNNYYDLKSYFIMYELESWEGWLWYYGIMDIMVKSSILIPQSCMKGIQAFLSYSCYGSKKNESYFICLDCGQGYETFSCRAVRVLVRKTILCSNNVARYSD